MAKPWLGYWKSKLVRSLVLRVEIVAIKRGLQPRKGVITLTASCRVKLA